VEPTTQIQRAPTITYRNPSNDTLGELWLKLYLNAFVTPQRLAARGCSDPRSFGFDRAAAGLDQARCAWNWPTLARTSAAGGCHSRHRAAGAVAGRSTIQPGERIRIQMGWTSQLRVCSRGQACGDFVMAGSGTELAVYDRGAVDSSRGTPTRVLRRLRRYTLDLTVPSSYVTGASGERAGLDQHPDGTTTRTIMPSR